MQEWFTNKDKAAEDALCFMNDANWTTTSVTLFLIHVK